MDHQQQIANAQAVLQGNVFVPVLFAKLAQLGIQPANEAEQETIVKMAWQCLHDRNTQAAQAAQGQSAVLKSAAARLGIPVDAHAASQAAASETAWIKQAADQLCGLEDITQAAAVLQTALLAA